MELSMILNEWKEGGRKGEGRTFGHVTQVACLHAIIRIKGNLFTSGQVVHLP
jgi:hypothetical protein